MWVPKLLLPLIKIRIFGQKKAKFCPKICFLGHIEAFSGSFGALLVGWLVVVVHGLYPARHLYTLFCQSWVYHCKKFEFCKYYPPIRPLSWTSGPSCRIEIQSQTDNCWQGMGKWTWSCFLAFRSKQRKRLASPFFLSNITTTNEDQLLLENLNQIDWGIEPNTFFFFFCMGRLVGIHLCQLCWQKQ